MTLAQDGGGLPTRRYDHGGGWRLSTESRYARIPCFCPAVAAAHPFRVFRGSLRPHRFRYAARYCFGNFQGLRYSGTASLCASLSPTIASFTGSNRIERPSFSDSKLRTIGTSTRT